MLSLSRAYNERMAELGFSTYVFIERIAANAAALHPFPEHNVALVRDALADAGFDITLLGPDAPEVGEGVYFQPEPFEDEVMGLLADALTLRASAPMPTHSWIPRWAGTWRTSRCSPAWATCSPATAATSS